jgi:dipeptidyl aminopeptidase/acylaminoacyl peptidase
MIIKSSFLFGVILEIVLVLVPQRQLLAQVESKDYGGTRFDFAVPGGNGFVIKPNHSEIAVSRPWVWYAPTFVKPTPLIGRYPNKSLAWLFTRLLEKGIWIGGVDVGESWGNAQGRKAYTNFYKYVRKKYALSPRLCMIGQSRGGAMVYNWAVEHPRDVRCIVGIYPVTDIESLPKMEEERIQKAYGMNKAELRKHLRKNNPIDRLAPLARAKVPIFQVHGDADNIVPPQQNTFEFARRYNRLGGKIEVEVVHGKGHEEVPQFFESERLLDFLLRYLRHSLEDQAHAATLSSCAFR